MPRKPPSKQERLRRVKRGVDRDEKGPWKSKFQGTRTAKHAKKVKAAGTTPSDERTDKYMKQKPGESMVIYATDPRRAMKAYSGKAKKPKDTRATTRRRAAAKSKKGRARTDKKYPKGQRSKGKPRGR